MKRLQMTKAAARLRSQKGETLIESVVSLLILAILMLTVTTMIVTSLRMTGGFLDAAKVAQEAADRSALVKAGSNSEQDTLHFRVGSTATPITVPVYRAENEGIVAFSPRVGG